MTNNESLGEYEPTRKRGKYTERNCSGDACDLNICTDATQVTSQIAQTDLSECNSPAQIKCTEQDEDFKQLYLSLKLTRID